MVFLLEQAGGKRQGSQTLRQQPVRSAIKPLPRRDWETRIFSCPSVLVPVGTASASSQGPFNTCIFAALGWDLCSRAPLAVRAGCWGSGAWPQHFCHRESRAQPAWRGLSRGGQRLSRFPTIFNVNIFFLAPYLRVPQLVFGFLLEGIAAYVAVFGVHTGDGKVSTFLRCLLGSASHQCSFSEL